MTENTKIEWATHTWNPWMGCTAVSPACDNCYAEKLLGRFGKVQWGNHPRVLTSDSNWKQPLRWAAKARNRHIRWQAEVAEGRYSFGRPPAPPKRPRVFCASLADVFDNQVPDVWRTRLWDLILETPELDWLLLTKRPQNIAKMIPIDWRETGLPAHIWLGISAENQTEYERRWPHLERLSAAVRFISHEPALSHLTVDSGVHRIRPSWFISGGEDRARAGRPAHHEVLTWARDLRDQCKAANIPFFFKQTVGKGEIPFDLQIRQFPTVQGGHND